MVLTSEDIQLRFDMLYMGLFKEDDWELGIYPCYLDGEQVSVLGLGKRNANGDFVGKPFAILPPKDILERLHLTPQSAISEHSQA